MYKSRDKRRKFPRYLKALIAVNIVGWIVLPFNPFVSIGIFSSGVIISFIKLIFKERRGRDEDLCK